MAGSKVKPEKPYAKFPLTANGNGQWSKKIRGKVRYCGPWADPTKALEKYLKNKPFWEAGENPPDEIYSVADLIDAFLAGKQNLIRTGELAPSTLRDYKAISEAIRKRFGHREASSLRPADFSAMRTMLAEGYSKRTLKQRLNIARMIFKSGKVETVGLQSPAKRLLRAEQKVRLFTAEQVKYMIDNATGELRDMVLLGINCAYGPSDCATLKPANLNCEWIEHARSKTGVNRRCPLWPETRPRLPFTLSKGELTEQFRELVEPFYVKNVTTFYTLRRTFETIATTADVPQAVTCAVSSLRLPAPV